MGEATDDSTTDIGAKDGRLKIPLNKSARRYLETKKDIERMEGRALTHDETLQIMLGYVEVTSPDKITQQTFTTLRELERFLEEHKEDLAAHCVGLFREVLLDVLRGRIQSRSLSEALIDVR